MITTLDKIMNKFFPMAKSFSTFTTPIKLNIKRDSQGLTPLWFSGFVADSTNFSLTYYLYY